VEKETLYRAESQTTLAEKINVFRDREFCVAEGGSLATVFTRFNLERLGLQKDRNQGKLEKAGTIENTHHHQPRV